MGDLLLIDLPADILYAITTCVPSDRDASSLGATCLTMHQVYARLVAGRRHRALAAAARCMGDFVDDWERFAVHYDDESFLCDVDEDMGEEDAPLTDGASALGGCPTSDADEEPNDGNGPDDDMSTSDSDGWSAEDDCAPRRCLQLSRAESALAGISIDPCTRAPDWSLDVNLPRDRNNFRNYMCDACARLAGHILDDPDHVKWPMVRIHMDQPHVWAKDWIGIAPMNYVPTPPVGELRAPEGLEAWIDADAAQCLADSIHAARSVFDATFAPYLDGYTGPVPFECNPTNVIHRSSLVSPEASDDGDDGEGGQRPARYVTQTLRCYSYYKWHTDEDEYESDGDEYDDEEGEGADGDDGAGDMGSIDPDASDGEMQVSDETARDVLQRADGTNNSDTMDAPAIDDGDNSRRSDGESDQDTLSRDDEDSLDNEDVDAQYEARRCREKAIDAARRGDPTGADVCPVLPIEADGDNVEPHAGDTSLSSYVSALNIDDIIDHEAYSACRSYERERWESRDSAGRPVATVTIDTSEDAPRQHPFVGFNQDDRLDSCQRYYADNVPPAALVRMHYTLPSVVGNPRAWLPIGATKVACRRPERGHIWHYVLVCCDPASPMWGAAMVARAMTDRWPAIVWLPGADNVRAAIETYRRDHHHRRHGPALALGVREGFAHWLCTSRRLPVPPHWQILREGAIKAGQPAVPMWTGFPRFGQH
ncbi:hypothetical protein psal_cds_1105 [Pandoravirus salinus]|uniref:F-box domain containing protein n=1 Tax=Pandoravirus salinus TaxID=1349410 RepID=S4W0L7_9VIRU|nr:hypothetical protein psal_cds_1105 [Pandoravirus salinus]AGO85331.1 hypothetical protein psal_cds_1105 [Pandoravirus salinus]